MLSRRSLTLLVMVLGLAACGSAGRTGPAHGLSSSQPGQPADLFVHKQPARAYVQKSIIETVQTGGESDEQVLERMRGIATRRGCDAVIFLGAKNTVIGRRGWFLTRKGFRGSCVVYTAEPRPQALAQRELPASSL